MDKSVKKPCQTEFDAPLKTASTHPFTTANCTCALARTGVVFETSRAEFHQSDDPPVSQSALVLQEQRKKSTRSAYLWHACREQPPSLHSAVCVISV